MSRFAAGIVLALWSTAAFAVPPLSAYGDLPSRDHLAISPDGRLLAYETSIEGVRAVVVVSIDEHKVVAAIKSADRTIRDIGWADNDHLLTVVSTTRIADGIMGPARNWALCFSYSISTGRQIQILGQPPRMTMNVTIGYPRPRTVDGHTLVYVTGIQFNADHSVPVLFAVDPDNGAMKTIDVGHPNTEDWLIDRDGALVAKSEYDDRSQTWTLFLRRGGDWQSAMSVPEPIDTPDIEGITQDGASVLIGMPNGDDTQVSIADGKATTTAHHGRFQSPIDDPLTHRIIGTIRGDATGQYHFLAKADQAAWDSIAAAYPDEDVALESWSDDRKRIVIRITGPRDGAGFELIDLNANHSLQVGSLYDGIGTFDVAEVRWISYPAADGLKIPAFLTLPKGRAPKNLPLIVLPHGGPATHDYPEFDWWSQALASRGYAVLRPEFRGSYGFGLSFLQAGFGQWGRKMQTDLSDGVRYLAKQGTIDPKRVCIVGASYGGYAALAGAALEHGVYRCAASFGGIADLHRFIDWTQRHTRATDASMRWWDRFLGISGVDDPKLLEISPIAHVADVTVPVLLIHGKDDTVVPIEQSEDMADALKKAGKTVTLVELDGEDHWLSRGETRQRMLDEMVRFLEANNPPN